MPTLRNPGLTAAVVALSLIGGCGLSAQRSLEQTAAAYGYGVQDLTGDRFTHRVYLNGAVSPPVRRLHVYIDGDGTPWLGPGRPALDPTPRNPLVLRLMALDPRPAIYLGRPCYAGMKDLQPCNPWYWTHGRFSELVVASMARALERLVSRLGVEQLVLIGYSGGGTLTMLLAPRVQVVTAVVTLAGNLDVQAWVEHHGYSLLTDSLDPARQAPLPTQIRQWHWAGAADLRVPPELVERSLARQPGAQLQVLKGVDHTCCWEREWPRLLGTLETTESAH